MLVVPLPRLGGAPEEVISMTTGAVGPRAEAGRPDESQAILRSRIDLSRLPPLSRAVTEHVIVASADFDYATDLVCDEETLAAAVAEVAAGAAVVADAAMVAAGITGHPVTCKSDEPLTERLARTAGISRAAAAVRLAFGQAGPGAIWVVGGAPAALDEIISRDVQPSFVIGLPVGLGRRGGGQGRAAGQWPALAEQCLGEGRSRRGRRRIQCAPGRRPPLRARAAGTGC